MNIIFAFFFLSFLGGKEDSEKERSMHENHFWSVNEFWFKMSQGSRSVGEKEGGGNIETNSLTDFKILFFPNSSISSYLTPTSHDSGWFSRCRLLWRLHSEHIWTAKLLWYFHSFLPNVLSAAVELIGPLIQPVTNVESIFLDFDRSLLCYGKQYIFQVECSVPFLSMCDKIDDCNI